MPFLTLGLSPALALAAQRLGFTTPTAIQSAAIPAILQGGDVQAQAHTGSGKTAAYVLPLLDKTTVQPTGKKVQILVLVPTRELAVQVGEVVRGLCQALPHAVKTVVAVGGVSINPQMMRLRGGADWVVATPGRLLDLVAHKALRLSDVRTLVLDEADRLLDMGFADELNQVLALLPAERQTLLLSATFEPEVQTLADQQLRQPTRLAVTDDTDTDTAPPPAITERAIEVDANRRTALLRHLAKTEGWERALVFVATQHTAEIVADKLYKNGVFATAFHGALSQGARADVLAELKAKRWEVVLATDLAARGIDIPDLPVVVNYDLPRSPVDYIHRIGRTGRAGASGVAISFVSASTEAHFSLIEKRQGRHIARERIEGFEPIEPIELAEVAEVVAPVQTDKNTGGIKGKRPSKKDKLRQAVLAKTE